MSASNEIENFLRMTVESADGPLIKKAETIGHLPEALRQQLSKTCAAIAQAFYDPEELRRATQVVCHFRNDFSGGLRHAVFEMTRCLIDNGGF